MIDIQQTDEGDFHRRLHTARYQLRAPLCYALNPDPLPVGTAFYVGLGFYGCGFAIAPGGWLRNMFSFPKGNGAALLDAAIERGAMHFDTYEGRLSSHALARGVGIVDRQPFDLALAQPGWLPGLHGTPDVVWLQR